MPAAADANPAGVSGAMDPSGFVAIVNERAPGIDRSMRTSAMTVVSRKKVKRMR